MQRPHNKISRALIAILWLIGLACVNANEPINYSNPSPADLKLIELIASYGKDASWITPDMRPTVIARVKLMMQGSPAQGAPDSDSVVRTLLALNDDETVQKLVNEYHAGNTLAEGTLEDYGREGALKYVAEDMFTGSLKWGGGGDVIIEPVRIRAATMVANEIANSPSFPQATRDWAIEMRYAVGHSLNPGSSECEAMKEWWKHNKAAVMSQQYAQATWLPERGGGDVGSLSQIPQPTPHVPQPVSASNAPGEQFPSPNHAGIVPNTRGHSWVLLAAVIIVGGLTGTVWYLRRSAR